MTGALQKNKQNYTTEDTTEKKGWHTQRSTAQLDRESVGVNKWCIKTRIVSLVVKYKMRDAMLNVEDNR